jgi:hypothetical protein
MFTLGKWVWIMELTVVCFMTSTVHGGLTFSFTAGGGCTADIQNGFTQAGAIWATHLTDNVTVNVNIDYQPLGAGILGSATSTKATYTYSDVRTALTTDRTSESDVAAVANLPVGNSFNMLINYTSNNPDGWGSSVPYLDNDGDANNTTLRITTANAKALGLLAANNPASDAAISFSSNFSWDFDSGDGITPGTYDFVGVAVHELGHALGFVSGVDILDSNSPNGMNYFADNIFTYVSTPDLFRFSATSLSQGAGTIDWTTNGTNKYFSIDGGVTPIANFSLGTNHGDGRQASHWKDGLGIGIMDPTTASGELCAVTNNDVFLMDVIGWNTAESSTTPEPEFLGLFVFLPLAHYLTGRRVFLRKGKVGL